MSAVGRLRADTDDGAALSVLVDVLGAPRKTRETVSGRTVCALAVDRWAGRVALLDSTGWGRLATLGDRRAWLAIAETLAGLVRSGGLLVTVDPVRDLGELAYELHAHRVTRSATLPVTLSPLVVSASLVGLTRLADLADDADVLERAEILLYAAAARARLVRAA
ncbi:hypothetical protein ACFTWF_44295 [Rhodococcus sp. NPDC056960]|uniref:hypothetical protein n=1 Tax=Rhodococcus sp. NPDC056960 TaxID=3345982 RepID=UPI00362F14A8